jgi:hypothetical protein
MTLDGILRELKALFPNARVSAVRQSTFTTIHIRAEVDGVAQELSQAVPDGGMDTVALTSRYWAHAMAREFLCGAKGPK